MEVKRCTFCLREGHTASSCPRRKELGMAMMHAQERMRDPECSIDDVVLPIDMILHCPACGMQHVDAPDTNYDPHYEGHMIWTNPPHRSHLCHGCGHIWRPADVPTNGVDAIETRGKNDSPAVHPKRFTKVPNGWVFGDTDLGILCEVTRSADGAVSAWIRDRRDGSMMDVGKQQ